MKLFSNKKIDQLKNDMYSVQTDMKLRNSNMEKKSMTNFLHLIKYSKTIIRKSIKKKVLK